MANLEPQLGQTESPEAILTKNPITDGPDFVNRVNQIIDASVGSRNYTGDRREPTDPPPNDNHETVNLKDGVVVSKLVLMDKIKQGLLGATKLIPKGTEYEIVVPSVALERDNSGEFGAYIATVTVPINGIPNIPAYIYKGTSSKWQRTSSAKGRPTSLAEGGYQRVELVTVPVQYGVPPEEFHRLLSHALTPEELQTQQTT